MTMTRAAVDLDVDMTSPFQENVHDFNESPQVVSILNDDDNPSFTLPRARTPTMRHSASHSMQDMSSTTGRAAYGGKSPRRQHRYHGGHQRHYHSRLSSPEISPLSLSEPDLYQLRRRHEAYYPSPLGLEPTRPEQQQPLQQQHEAFTWTPKQVVEPLVSSPAISSPILPSPPASYTDAPPQPQAQPQQQQQQSTPPEATKPASSKPTPTTKKNKYPCPFAQSHRCTATFTTSGHAARHGKKHTGEKGVVCPVCNKAFTRKDNMKQHHRTHQPPETRRAAAAAERRNSAACGSSSGKHARRDSKYDAPLPQPRHARLSVDMSSPLQLADSEEDLWTRHPATCQSQSHSRIPSTSSQSTTVSSCSAYPYPTLHGSVASEYEYVAAKMAGAGAPALGSLGSLGLGLQRPLYWAGSRYSSDGDSAEGLNALATIAAMKKYDEGACLGGAGEAGRVWA